MPADLVAPEKPSINAPTVPGSPITVFVENTPVSGRAEPGSKVSLYKDGSFLANTVTPDGIGFDDYRLDHPVYWASLSPDGQKLAYVDDNDYFVWIKDLASGATTLVTQDEGETVNWSPDGTKLLYNYWYQGYGTYRHAIFDTTTGMTQHFLDDPQEDEDYPSWSPDGNKVVFTRSMGGNYNLWVRDLSGTLFQLTSGMNYPYMANFSPNGQKVSFIDNDLHYVVNVADQSVVSTGERVSWKSTAWSPDSTKISFVGNHTVDGQQMDYIGYVEVGTNTVHTVYDIKEGSFTSWVPGSEKIVYSSANDQSFSYEMSMVGIEGTKETLKTGMEADTFLGTTQSGTAFSISYDNLYRTDFRNGFTFETVQLSPGVNNFQVIAEDESQNISEPSDSISVTYSQENVPDISVAAENLLIFPIYPKPGENVLLQATIKNNSKVTIDNVEASFYLWDPAGNLKLLNSTVIPHIDGGAEETFGGTFVLGNLTGTYSVIAIVDPADKISEVDESNNYAVKDVFVTDKDGLIVSASVNRPQFSAGEDAVVTLYIRNNGADTNVDANVVIQDEAGNAVFEFDKSHHNLPYGAYQPISLKWNTGSTFAGTYWARAVVADSGQTIESTVPFAILPDIRVDSNITTDKVAYGTNDYVTVNSTITNVGSNYIIPQLKVGLRIQNQNGVDVTSSEKLLASIFPATSSSVSTTWNTVLSAPGDYQAVLAVYNGDQVVSSKTVPFKVNPVYVLSGTVVGAPSTVASGKNFEAAYALHNLGNTATAGTIRVLLVDPESQAILGTSDQVQINLAVDTTATGSFTFSSQNLALKTYQLRLQYEGQGLSKIIASAPITIKDILPPVATILAPVEGATYTRNVAFSAVLSDDASGIDKAEYALDNGPWQLLPPVDAAKGKYGALWVPVPRDQGLHTVRFRGTDRAGNVSTPVQATFTVIVDTTPPSLQITTPSDGSYTGSETLRVTGSVTDETGVQTLSINSETVAVQADGSFNHAILLKTGPNIITITATDLVGNVATVTRNVTYDNTPPVTAIMAGLPLYIGADGTLYIQGSTPITLSATDDAAGVQKTEYRIDSGAWLNYAPFIVPIEGSHVIAYRSTDTVGNVESEKVLKVIVDDTPPVAATTVGNPQYTASGNLYVSRKTVINITATDNAAGVKTIEYSIDGAPFAAYGEPFTLEGNAEGSHTIAYRSTDTLGNRETLKQLSLILDESTPTTTIEGSDPLVQGVVNTVSPVTAFTLTASDALSGVKEIWYRFDEDQWQLYSGPFTLAGLKAGSHTITYGAVDNVENVEPQQIITVRLVSMETQKGIATDPVVLFFSGKEHDRDDEEHGEHKEADRLVALLDSIKVTYYHAKDEEDFRLARRSGRYNIYLLTDDGKKEAGAEIREALYYGDGLLFIKARPESDDNLSDIFGVKFTGKSTSRDLVVDIPEGPLGTPGTLQTAGKTAVTTITSGTAKILGTVADKHGRMPAIIHNEYGRGKALLMTFNLADSPDGAKAADLLAKALHLLKPQEHYLRPLCSVPVTIQIGNSTESFGIEVEETIPASATVDTITPPVDPVEGTITWRQYLGSSERLNLGYYLNLPDAKGEYKTSTVLRYANYGAYRPYGRSEKTFTLTNDSAGLMQLAINDLLVLPVKEKKDRKRVDKALSELYRAIQEAVDRDQAEDNLERILDAVEEVAELSEEPKELRVKLDELMKIWQRKWYLLQNGHPKEIEGDDKNDGEDDSREADDSHDKPCDVVKLD